MSRGGARPISGPVPKKPRKRLLVPRNLEIKSDAGEGITPKDYLLGVLNETMPFDDARFRAAVAAAPYCHPRLDKAAQSKKEELAGAAKDAAVGKFATPTAPKLVVNNQ